MTWTDALRADPIPWLLKAANPPVRYGTLRDLLDRPTGDPEVRAARAAIPTWPPVAEVLAAQKRGGYWVKHDYYLPKHHGTFWTLSVLADLGLTRDDERIQRACEFMFTFQRETCGERSRTNGAFCRRRRVAGKDIVWDDEPAPCTHARIVRFLIQFGYGEDPRTRAAIDWLLAEQRDDGMWDCGRAERPGCLRASFDVLRVAALDAEAAAHPAVRRGAEVVCALLMERGMSKHHVGIPWTTLQYPYFDYGLIPTLEALARLGYTTGNPKIAGAVGYILSRQLPEGPWPLDQVPYRLPLDVGQPGEPNEWITLDALRALRRLGGAR